MVMAESGNYGGYVAMEVEQPEPADHAENDDDPTILLLVALALLGLVAICAGLALYASHLTRVLEPRYSVQIRDVQGLGPSPSSPVFNLTVHVDNKQQIRRVCKERSNVVVYYNEASDGVNETSIGWGKLPAFCVDRWSTRDLDLTLCNQGVFLSQRLREKMESDRQNQGMKMAVEIKPIHPEEATRACIVMCHGNGKFGQAVAAAPSMPCLQLCATERKSLYYKTQSSPIFLVHRTSPF
jgi:hypothetical protein